jgi:hypothetical protein
MKSRSLIMVICLFGLIFFGVTVFYVKATTEWIQQYPLGFDAHVRSIAQTADGGYILAGHNRLNSVTSSKALLVKVDSSGNTQWYKSYGIGGRFTDEAHRVLQTSDGGYAVAGVTWISNTTGNFWVFKVDASGNMLWNITQGGTYNCNAWGLIETDDGGYVGAGFTTYLAGDTDLFIIKIDSSGKVLWRQVYGTPGNDVAYSVIQSSDGGYAFTGRQNGHQLWLVKTDASGNSQWNYTYGDPKVGSNGYSLVQTSDGGYAMGGTVNTPSDFFLVKTDSNGTVQWSKAYGGKSEDIARSLVQTVDGGYLLAGYTESYGVGTQDVWLVKTDSLGNAMWNQTYGGAGTDVANSLTRTKDGGYALGGNTESFGFASAALLLIKTDSAGLSPPSVSTPETSAWVPPPENAVASTVAATVVTGGVSVVVAAALIPPGLPTDSVTERIRDFLPDSLKSWLEALMSSKLKLAVDERTGSPFLPTKSEVIAYIVSVIVLGFSFSYVKVDAFSQILLVLPVILGTSVIVGFVKTVILVGYARVRGVWAENKLWYFGLATFLVTTFLFRVPFSSPSRIVHFESKLTKRLDTILSLADIIISLAFAGGFYLLMIGGYPAIGSVGLAMCIIGAFFDSLPMPPLNGRTIFKYSKAVWVALFAVTLILYASWLLLL